LTVFRARPETLVDICPQWVGFSQQSVSTKVLVLQWIKREAYMLIDEKDGDVLTLGVLAERSFDTLNFRLWENTFVSGCHNLRGLRTRLDYKEVLVVLRYLSNPC
jgi:hypothetical protein